MIVSQAELDLIGRSKMRKTQMRLPVKQRPDGSHVRCPMQAGHPYQLRAQSGERPVVITVIAVRKEKLAAITEADARAEGYAGVAGVLSAWAKTYGEPDAEQLVWAISFVRGDESRFMGQDEPVFLARALDQADYTTRCDRLRAGEVLMPLEEDLRRARALALERKVDPQREMVERMASDAGVLLKDSMLDMKARNRLELIKREAERIIAAFAVAGLLHSDRARQSCLSAMGRISP